jgi:hypothetical protein
MVWRRMRSAGALGLQNGVWVLPRRPANEQLLGELVDSLRAEKGGGQVFVARSVDESFAQELAGRFAADREQEYTELVEHCEALMAELYRETTRRKFAFAELGESEDSLKRLYQWRDRVRGRDFFPGEPGAAADRVLERCRRALVRFAGRVYANEGVRAPERRQRKKKVAGRGAT